MSIVTNVIMCFSGIEKQNNVDEEYKNIKEINKWLQKYQRGTFVGQVDKDCGGYKVLEQEVRIGAFNYLDLEGFIEFARSLKWVAFDDLQVFVKRDQETRFEIALGTVERWPPEQG